MSRSEACNVGKGRIRIFLGPWAKCYLVRYGGVHTRPHDPPCSPESRRRNSSSPSSLARAPRRSVNIARVLSLFIENASRILLRLQTVNQARVRERERERENFPSIWNAPVRFARVFTPRFQTRRICEIWKASNARMLCRRDTTRHLY